MDAWLVFGLLALAIGIVGGGDFLQNTKTFLTRTTMVGR